MARPGDPDGGELRVLKFGDRDIHPIAAHSLTAADAARLQARGNQTPTVYELHQRDADAYYHQFQEAIRGNPFAEVLVDRGLDSYQAADTRLFVTDDLRAGGAIFGRELGSLFSLGDTYKGVSRTLTQVRVDSGGDTIICRGTKLRSLNEGSGFLAVAETPGPQLKIDLPGDHGKLSIMVFDPGAVKEGLHETLQPVLVHSKTAGKAAAAHYLQLLHDEGRPAALAHLESVRDAARASTTTIEGVDLGALRAAGFGSDRIKPLKTTTASPSPPPVADPGSGPAVEAAGLGE
ncbi:hypothetical protein [Nocardia sp. NPDC060249]|uniref:hypothetical protein n=1 Tax=Nocardia sp. NPDC060249 TaxID=3347082 RepID=UPI003662B994